MPIGSPQWMYKSGEAFTLDQSLRFDDSSKAYLSRLQTEVGDTKTWTWSGWVKRSKIGAAQTLFGCIFSGASNYAITFLFDSDDKLCLDAWVPVLKSTAVFRDTSAWMHLVCAFDTTQSTESDRVKFYVNGSRISLVEQSSGGWAGYPAEDHADGQINRGSQTITISSRQVYADDHYVGGYYAEVHFIDGTALTPTSFGETGDYGEWKPKEVSGLTYGTNGFYLPFKNDYEVEGFSAVTYKGTGIDEDAGGTYIGGTGFNPDLVWIKRRNGTNDNFIHDTIRGVNQRIKSNSTDAEYDDNNALLAFNSDGFTVADDAAVGASGGSYVAWCWDMGGDSYGIPKTITAGGNANHSTSENKIGGSSIAFDGTGDYLSIAQTPDFDFGTRDYTLECWVMNSGNSTLIHTEGTDQYGLYLAYEGGVKYRFSAGHVSDWGATLYYTVAADSSNWHHLAVVCHNGTTTLYYDGVARDSTSTVVDVAGNQGASIIGGRYGGVYNYNGYLDEIRISNKARYTSTFTPSTSAFTSDANTVLLIHSDTSNGSTTFTDSSGATKNTTGSITSYVAANPTYGQSIVSYTGSGTTGTVGHGLSGTPEMYIVKNRDAADDWAVYHEDVGNDKRLGLNAAGAETATNNWNSTSPTSSVFTVYGGENRVNDSGEKYIAYCFDSVAGYSKIGSYTGDGGSSHTITTGFKPAWVMIKCTGVGARPWVIFDGVRSGGLVWNDYLKANESEAETVNNTNRKITVSDTGFTLGIDAWVNENTLEFIYIAFADKREYAYWLDQSGNNNDWTPHSLTESDISVDSPTNNFATWNPLMIFYANYYATYSEGNLKGTRTDNGGLFSTIPFSSGKWYAEILILNTATNVSVGMLSPAHVTDNEFNIQNKGVAYQSNNGEKHIDGSGSSYGDTYTVGDIIGIAIDLDAGTPSVTFYKNNVSQGAITGFASGTHYVFATKGGGNGWIFVGNFGQDSSFAGNKTAQGNQDGNEIGDFYYTPPSGYLALCTSNLPAVAVTPSEHFNPVLYTGTGGTHPSTTQSVTGVGFQPDLTWIKIRSQAYQHFIYDAVRGATKVIYSDSTAAEATGNQLTSFNSDGFTVANIDTGVATNASGESFVAWNWKAGGSGSANTDGNMAETVTVSANTDAGFSIVKYTGDGAAGTVGHGLSKAPEMIIVKSTNGVDHFFVYHSGMASDAETDRMLLSTINSIDDDVAYWNDTAPTSSVFTVGTYDGINQDDDTFIAYCFHSVDGFSKVGSYKGNGQHSGNGPFVYTGFKPAYLMVKRTDATGHWWIKDSARDATNDTTDYLRADGNNADDVGWGSGSSGGNVNFNSNGFKWDGNYSEMNASGGTYIYIAFAETPFKYSNAQ